MEPYMIQRLCKPKLVDGKPIINPFGFGGGLRYGGLSKEAFDLLSPIINFDYMGRAEFEDGILADAIWKLCELIDADKIVIGHVFIDATPLYYCCVQGQEDDVRNIIKKLAKKRPLFRLKEPAYVYEALKGDFSELCGWFDLKNNYLFFIKQERRDQLIKLLREDSKE